MLIFEKLSPQTFESHEDGLIEFYGIVNADGTVNAGCARMTVTKTGTGAYTLALVDLVPIQNTDFAIVDATNSAFNNGSSLTAQPYVSVIGAGATPVADAVASVPYVANGLLKFDVVTQVAGALADFPFSFEFVVSSQRNGKR